MDARCSILPQTSLPLSRGYLQPDRPFYYLTDLEYRTMLKIIVTASLLAACIMAAAPAQAKGGHGNPAALAAYRATKAAGKTAPTTHAAPPAPSAHAAPPAKYATK